MWLLLCSLCVVCVCFVSPIPLLSLLFVVVCDVVVRSVVFLFVCCVLFLIMSA